MTNELDPAAEQLIREACDRGEHGLGAKRAFEAYGSEIFAFLIARLRVRSEAEEAFSAFAEDLCNGLPSFEFRCSMRGYCYVLARNASSRLTRQPHRRAEGQLSHALPESITALMSRERTPTEMHRRTDIKHRVRRLRDRLPDEDQLLLILHIDRRLPWNEIAIVMHAEEPLDAAGQARESARLRKRFERIKSVLRELAKDDGLLDS
jgi:RNA polymerase sigma-70 factor, ECF subfamily